MLGEVLTATVTPFDADGNVDYDRYRELCGFLVDNGSDGVVVNGTTGEASTLSEEERVGLIRAALDAIGDRATVIAYNIPGRVVVNIEPETMSELAEIPNVTAVKQSNADLDQARHIVELGLDLYAGDDNLVLPFVELGGRGGVCVHTHIVGPQVKELVRLAREGDLDGARQIDEELAPAIELIGVVTGPIQIKAALNMLGHEVGGLRLPLVEASDEEKARIRSCLERLKLLEPARV